MYGVHENVYAVQTGDGVVLIDTGMDKKSYDVICRNLKYWGMEKQKINKKQTALYRLLTSLEI